MLRYFCLLLSIFYQEVSFSQYYGFHPSSRLYLGAGYDALMPTKAFLNCLTFDGVRSTSGNRPLSSVLEITGINSSRELHEKVGFSSFLEGSYLFMEGKASMSYDFEKDFSGSSFNWLVVLRADYGSYVLENPRIIPEFLDLEPALFEERCGNEFVIEEKRSVMVFAVMSLKNVNESEKKDLQAKLSFAAGGAGFDVSFGAAYKNFMSKASALGEISIKINSYGGKGLSSFKDLLHLESFMDYQRVLNTFSQYVENMDAEDAFPSLSITTGVESFRRASESPFRFKKSVLVDLYYSYQFLSRYLKNVHDLLNSLDLSPEEFESYYREKERVFTYLYELEERAKSCFDSDSQEACTYKADTRELDFRKLMSHLSCEEVRQRALKEEKINEDFYFMSKRRNFIPIFKNNQVSFWKECPLS